MSDADATYTTLYSFEEPGILSVTLRGVFSTVDELAGFVRGANSRARRVGAGCLLADERDLQVDISPLEAMEFARTLAQTVSRPLLHVAVFNCDHLAHINKYFDLALNGPTLVFREFATRQDAIRWLRSQC